MKKIGFILTIVIVLTLFTFHDVAHANTVPTISIQAVTKDEKVTIVTHNFPAGKEFRARMGLIGTKGIDGILVGTVDSKKGGSLKFTFEIPETLKSEDQIAIRLDSTTGGYYSYNWFTNTTFGDHAGGTPAEEPELTPSISIISVKEDTHVTVKGIDFPADESFEVLMGEEDTKGLAGVVVDSITAGEDTSFQETFDIPESLKGEEKIAIRFESEDSELATYAVFKNETGACGGGTNGDEDGYKGIPTITILSVEEDKEVTVKTHNFPKDKTFEVLMGYMGTKGIDGIEVTTFDSGEGGEFTKTFEIPEKLKGEYRIAIRLQTPDGHFYAYNWFYNNTTDAGTGKPGGYVGIPTFFIESVEEDKTVTIKTHNFPADIEFKVLMGKMGTKGVGGIEVTTINSGSGGEFTETFDIPDALKGDYQIAIRLEAKSGGYYAYNWFYNNTTSDKGNSKHHSYAGIPTFFISGVKKDVSVTIRTNNFPTGYEFKVYMGKMGTQGIGGTYVTSINSGAGGELVKTFTIPSEYVGDSRIAIRLVSTFGNFYAYNWFYNTSYP